MKIVIEDASSKCVYSYTAMENNRWYRDEQGWLWRKRYDLMDDVTANGSSIHCGSLGLRFISFPLRPCTLTLTVTID